jgi:hypothetical protein
MVVTSRQGHYLYYCCCTAPDDQRCSVARELVLKVSQVSWDVGHACGNQDAEGECCCKTFTWRLGRHVWWQMQSIAVWMVCCKRAVCVSVQIMSVLVRSATAGAQLRPPGNGCQHRGRRCQHSHSTRQYSR